MKKAYALVLGIIFSIASVLVPFTSAFADSSVAIPQFVFSLMFASVTTPTFVDVTNYNAATDTTTSDTSVHLPNSAGSYSQINRTGIPIAQNLICLRFTVDQPSENFFQDIDITPYINGSPSHLYGTYTQSDNNNSISYYMFFYIGQDSHRVKDSQGVDITPWGIRITRTNGIDYTWSYASSSTSLYYYNYIQQPQTIDPGEAATLALDIINVLQLSSLAQSLGIVAESIDTTDLENITHSILDQINDQYSIDNESSVNTILRGYANQAITSSSITIPGDNEFYICFSLTGDYSYNLYVVDIPMVYDPYYTDPADYEYPTSEIYIGGGSTLTAYSTAAYTYGYFGMWTRRPITPGTSNYYHIYRVYIYSPDLTSPQYLFIKFNFNKDISVGGRQIVVTKYKSNTLQFQTLLTNWIHDIWLSVTAGNNNTQTLDSITDTTDTVTTQVQTVTQFEDTYNSDLSSSASQIDVSSYEIQQTSGMAFMRTYTELNFDRMQNFRILFLTPLILALAAFFLRRRS